MDACGELVTFFLLGVLAAGVVGVLAYSALARRLSDQGARLAALEATVRAAAGEPASAPPSDLGAESRAQAAPPEGSEPPSAPTAARRPAAVPAGSEIPTPGVPAPESLPEEPSIGHPLAEPAAAGEPAPALPEPPPPPPRAVDWERWIGVRGAAVLGGIVLSIAGLLFLQYTIEAGWFTPEVRVVIAFAAGLVALGVSPLQRWRGYQAVSEALAGAGVVLLYGALWAGHVLYGLFGAPAAFAGLVAVTAVCGGIAWRHGSRVVAVLGLLGGFAAPLVLSAPVDDRSACSATSCSSTSACGWSPGGGAGER